LHSAYLKAIKDYIQVLMLQVVLLFPLISGVERDQQNGLLIGGFYFIIYLMNSFASKSASHLEKRNRRIVFITLLAGFTAGIVSGLFYEIGLVIPALISFILIYIIENIRKPVMTGYVADRVSEEVLSSVLSAQSQIKTFMTAAIALVFGIIADKFGVAWSLSITSGILMFSICVLSLVRTNKS